MFDEELSARHFTTSAINIIEQLDSRAADRSMGPVAITEHTMTMLLLWSLLRWERKVGLVALERCGVEPDSLARGVDELLREVCAEARRSPTARRQFQVLPSGQCVQMVDDRTLLEPLLAQAEHEALGMGHDWVGSEHLVLAIIQRACPRLRGLLEKHSVSYEKTRQAIQDLLRG